MNFSLPVSRSYTRTALVVAGLVGICAAWLVIGGYNVRPSAERVYPYADEVGVEPNTAIKLSFNRGMDRDSITSTTFSLRDEHGRAIPGTVSYDGATRTAVLLPMSALEQGQTYKVMLQGGHRGILDRHDRPLAKDQTWSFTIGIHPYGTPAEGPGGPILLVTSGGNGFSSYYAEILRNEGLNEFDVKDITEITAADFSSHDLALIGEIPVDEEHIRILVDWVAAGGNLIAMRPARRLAEALGMNFLTSGTSGTVQQGGYLTIDSNQPAGAGLLHRPIQFHGDADRLSADHATILATLYSDKRTATQFPAVSSLPVGKGTAIIFSYDLAKSIVYTRQGNPEWSGIERDGLPPVRSSDLFFGASEGDLRPDWVDPELIAIPQADIQQRLLANLITLTNLGKKPLPRFWYLPRDLKAAVLMTGDDHGHGGTSGRFLNFQRKSAKDCSLENWDCIRATSNIFVGSVSSAQAADFAKQGFEIGLHVYTGCTDWPSEVSRDSDGVQRRGVIRKFADDLYSQQLKGFAIHYPELPPPVSNRTDCVTWGDYDTQPQVEVSHGIRLDTNYYYWPAKWVKDKPGLFTGSGLPMRFARRDGSLIDVYQAATQMTDESEQTYPFTVDALLTNALGSSEYFGVFTANMHNDYAESPGADAIVASAQKHNVPVISAAQMLKWLDGRNASQFRDLKWSNNELSFSINVGIGGNGIQAMLPFHAAAGEIDSVTLNGTTLPWRKRTVAGLTYAVVRAASGVFRVSYGNPVAR